MTNYGLKRWYTIFTLVKGDMSQFFSKKFSISLGASIAEQRGIRSPMVARYVVGSLVNRFTMPGTVYRLLRGMLLNRFTPGMVVHCSGRFDRRRRKTYKRFKIGKAGIYKFDFTLEYSSSFVRQKYGVCGIKVWLGHYQEELFRDYYFLDSYYGQINYRKKKFKVYKEYKKKIRRLNWGFFDYSNTCPTTRRASFENSKGVFFSSWYGNKQAT
jgi:ribosomal protein S3